jgi:Protein of unknown function (DUF2852)
MTHEHDAGAKTQDGPRWRGGHWREKGADRGDYLWWARTPGFNPFKLLAVLAGFAVFPPLGIAALVYFIWNSRRHSWQGREAWGAGRGCGHRGHMSRTGNTAFDEHREKVLSELEEERKAFAEYRAEQRRKRDQDAFDAFQEKRKTDGDKPAGTQE